MLTVGSWLLCTWLHKWSRWPRHWSLTRKKHHTHTHTHTHTSHHTHPSVIPPHSALCTHFCRLPARVGPCYAILFNLILHFRPLRAVGTAILMQFVVCFLILTAYVSGVMFEHPLHSRFPNVLVSLFFISPLFHLCFFACYTHTQSILCSTSNNRTDCHHPLRFRSSFGIQVT